MGSSREGTSDNLRSFLRDVREVLLAPTSVSQDELNRLVSVCDALMVQVPLNESTYLVMRSTVQEVSQECPYRGLPVAHLSLRSCHQVGHLQRADRRGFLDAAFSIRCTGRFFGGFLDGWLLLYGSQTVELRPRTTIHVAKAWDCAGEDDFKWPERVFGVEDFNGSTSFFQAPSVQEKSSWLLALTGADQNAVSDEDGIYVEPNEVSGPTREELNKSFNYDTPCTPPRRVESSENFRQKYADIKSRIASQLLLTPPTASKAPQVKVQPPPVPSSSSWWFRRRKKNVQNTTEATKKKLPNNDPTYEIIEAK